MPNRYQVIFLVSFFSVFATLFFTSRFIGEKLRAAGYDVSEIILIGLPRNRTLDRDVSQRQLGSGAMPDFNSSTFQQLLALVLAVITSAFIYYKFASSKRKPVLNPQQWQEFPLTEKIVISPNTAIYRFGLPHPQAVLGLPIGQHISVAAEINGKDIMRSYTPTSSDNDLGHFDLLVKAYEKGNISRYISLLKIGDKIRVKGPKGQFTYSPRVARHLGMIAGGTGITPMLQIIRAVLKNPEDKTKHPDRFTVYYVLNNPPVGWKGGVGFVTKEQIKEHLPSTDHDIKILMCGPPPMMTVMKKYLAELNYPAPRTVSKLVDEVFLF
ncbi:unnamed protein product [Somion occarium]|uniref:FAD-binding FR-type domain-containing protein n=1 Tax=Somion occarium TaxID=3059160 RepID=A0ABP1CPF9_9APHY